jgi:hypothetical protein
MSNSHGWKEALPAAAFFVGFGDDVEVGVAVAVKADAMEVVRASGIAMQIFTSKPEISILRIVISSMFEGNEKKISPCSPPSLAPTFCEHPFAFAQAGS